MRLFSVELRRPEGFFLGEFTPLPEGVKLTAESWSASARWGFDDARISATGPVNEIEALLTWLAGRVLIRNEFGSAVWVGRVHEVEVQLGGSLVSVNLSDVHNRVQVAYVYRTGNGGEATAYTDWAENADSIAQFGTRELRLTLPEGASVGAVALRDRVLANSAWPSPVLRSASGGNMVLATLHCRNHLEALQNVYYSNPDGLVEYVEGADAYQPINDGLTSTGISFAADNKIYGPIGSFGSLRRGDTIHVSGATDGDNNGVFGVAEDVVTTTDLKVTETRVITAGAGPSITIAFGGPRYTHVAQSFQLPAGASAWVAKRIAVRLRGRRDEVGWPLEGETMIALCTDSGGVPTTVLDSHNLTNAEVNALPDQATWVEVELTLGTATLNTATTYWVVVHHTLQTRPGVHVAVSVDTKLGYGSTLGRLYTGSAWVEGDTPFHMPFRITGDSDSVVQAEDMLNAGINLAGVTRLTTGHAVWQYRTGEQTAWDELDELLDMGSSNGRELFLRWGNPRFLDTGRIALLEQPDSDESTPLLGRDGQLRQANGEMWEPGRLAAGMWVELDGMPGLAGMSSRPRAMWVESSSYHAATDTLSLETAGARDPLAGIGRREG